ncbi:hypothetical protein Sru01_27570 [Sphaerisporangium rufum]|uniref:Uncharacterized protein n=1 Tax=Sphaerisporangium rufum TaxID=1381558 RepID=A0A919V500_9ACTN|nr:hypothetical protein [Sphaerisporangium rufum]GII77775.1 hypothetical protein Sru01_27570 [Sphaerisporangium rufum]
MDMGYIVVVILGVIVVASALGVALVAIVLHGIHGDPVEWPVSEPRQPAGPRRLAPRRRVASLTAARDDGTRHPEWTGGELAGEDLRPVGTHEEKHAVPGRARWW